MDKGKGIRVSITGILLILVGVALAYWSVPEDAGPQQPLASKPKQTPPFASTEDTVTQVKTTLPTAYEEVVSASESASESGQENSTVNSDDVLGNVNPEQKNPYFNREVKEHLAQVEDDYAEQIQYSSFSIPIQNRDSLRKYIPSRSFGAERPLDIEGEKRPLIRLQTDKHRYFSGEDIHVAVSLAGLTGDPWVKVQTRLIGEGLTLVLADARFAGQQVSTYNMNFTDLDALADTGIEEYRVVARITIDDQVYEIGAPVSYVASVAMVTDVGLAQVSGEYLYIPVYVTTTKPGYHELSANLYTAQSEKPLVHLSVQQELQGNHGLMQLEAHIASLKVWGDSGPYLLKDISFTRMPSPPEFITEYGSSSQDSYEVNGYAFDD
jgi:hypothetical protein